MAAAEQPPPTLHAARTYEAVLVWWVSHCVAPLSGAWRVWRFSRCGASVGVSLSVGVTGRSLKEVKALSELSADVAEAAADWTPQSQEAVEWENDGVWWAGTVVRTANPTPSHTHFTMHYTCCYDEIKGTQSFKICSSHADSLNDSLSHTGDCVSE